MLSKAKKTERIDSIQREQYEYSRRRINQKKNLMRHFITFLAGCLLIIIINPVLGYGNEFFFKDWYIWAILIWAFVFMVHALNVYILNSFMGKEWEDQQLEKLKARQAEKLAELQKKVDTEFPLPKPTSESNIATNNNSLPTDQK